MFDSSNKKDMNYLNENKSYRNTKPYDPSDIQMQNSHLNDLQHTITLVDSKEHSEEKVQIKQRFQDWIGDNVKVGGKAASGKPASALLHSQSRA